MDATIEKIIEQLVCEHCRPKVHKVLEYERLKAAASAALGDLRELGYETRKGKGSADDEPVDRAAAMAATRERLGLGQPQEPDPLMGGVNPVTGRKVGAASASFKQVPMDAIMRCIRGEIAPHVLASELGLSYAVIRSRVNALIGPPTGKERWRSGVGFIRHGVPARPAEMALPIPPPAEPRIRIKKSKARPGASRTVNIPDSDLQRVIDKRASVDDVARKYKCVVSTVYARIAEFKERVTAVKAKPRITDVDLHRLLAKTKTTAQMAHKYRLTEGEVRNQVAEFKALQETKRRVSSVGGEQAPSIGASTLSPDEVAARVLAEPSRSE